MRKLKFANGEHYHIYNRGVDKRIIYNTPKDYNRFLESLHFFNTTTVVGGLREHRYKNPRNPVSGDERLVDVMAYCLNPNHYHLILRQNTDNGISEFIKRVGGGYTKYFNETHKRSGSLFQGSFKALHITEDAYLRHLSTYVVLNNFVHNYPEEIRNQTRSSIDEYFVSAPNQPICSNFDLIIRDTTSRKDFIRQHKDILRSIQERKDSDAELAKLCAE